MTIAKAANIQPTPSICEAYFGSFVSYKSTIEISTFHLKCRVRWERDNQFKANESVAGFELNQTMAGRSAERRAMIRVSGFSRANDAPG
jgi:hypothetical protein